MALGLELPCLYEEHVEGEIACICPGLHMHTLWFPKLCPVYSSERLIFQSAVLGLCLWCGTHCSSVHSEVPTLGNSLLLPKCLKSTKPDKPTRLSLLSPTCLSVKKRKERKEKREKKKKDYLGLGTWRKQEQCHVLCYCYFNHVNCNHSTAKVKMTESPS